MESERGWEQNALVNELIQGMEIARKLKEDLNLPSSVDTRDSLLERILSSYDKALLILKLNASISKPTHIMHQPHKTSSLEDLNELKQKSKKRKKTPEWMDHVRVKIENGVEGPNEDGYNWRKYGQKDILSAKYPRSYYRCTFRNTKGCCATKQVQRSNEDPTIFDIIYRGSHTCCQGNDAILAPKSSDIENKSYGYDKNVHHTHASHESLTKLRNTSTLKTDNLANIEETAYPFASTWTSCGFMTQDNHLLLSSSNDPFFTNISETHLLSPNTPQSSYFPSPSFLVDEMDGVCNKPCSDSDVAGIISDINSPIFDFNFSLEEMGIDSDFPFHASGFFF